MCLIDFQSGAFPGSFSGSKSRERRIFLFARNVFPFSNVQSVIEWPAENRMNAGQYGFAASGRSALTSVDTQYVYPE